LAAAFVRGRGLAKERSAQVAVSQTRDGEFTKPDAHLRQKGPHPADTREQAECPAEPPPIETAQDPWNLVLVALYKLT
jgi:hypothetical protein